MMRKMCSTMALGLLLEFCGIAAEAVDVALAFEDPPGGPASAGSEPMSTDGAWPWLRGARRRKDVSIGMAGGVWASDLSGVILLSVWLVGGGQFLPKLMQMRVSIITVVGMNCFIIVRSHCSMCFHVIENEILEVDC